MTAFVIATAASVGLNATSRMPSVQLVSLIFALALSGLFITDDSRSAALCSAALPPEADMCSALADSGTWRELPPGGGGGGGRGGGGGGLGTPPSFLKERLRMG